MKHLVRALGSAGLLLVAGCGAPVAFLGRGGDGLSTLALGPGSAASLYPIEVGRTWTYRSVEIRDGGPPQPGLDQRFVITKAVPGGAVLQRYYGSWAAPATLVQESASGVVLSRYVPSGPPATDSITILKFPLRAGASWPGRTLVGATERIEAVGLQSVEVPMGQFEAWHIQNQLTYAAGGGDTLDYWYAPKVGLVEAIERVTMMDGATPHHYQVTASLASASVPTP